MRKTTPLKKTQDRQGIKRIERICFIFVRFICLIR